LVYHNCYIKFCRPVGRVVKALASGASGSALVGSSPTLVTFCAFCGGSASLLSNLVNRGLFGLCNAPSPIARVSLLVEILIAAFKKFFAIHDLRI
jgi:hypothetical protein